MAIKLICSAWEPQLDVVLHTQRALSRGYRGLYSVTTRATSSTGSAQNATAKFTKYSLIAHWDASIRLIWRNRD